MTTEFWIQMLVYAASLGSFGGVVLTRLNYLEKKMDLHNEVIERTYKLEESVESLHYRLGEIREELKDVKN